MGRLLELLLVFFKIGLCSIGGGYAIIPLIQEQVVEKLGWIPQQVFTDIITISQMTPGPLAVNTSTFVGIQVGGLPGAIFATFGCVISGIVISIVLYRFFQSHRQSTYALEVLNGLKASSCGLILSAAVTILLLAFTGTSAWAAVSTVDWIAVALFAAALFVLRKWKVNPILLMVVAGVIGGVVYR